jgi:hypothetical protein
MPPQQSKRFLDGCYGLGRFGAHGLVPLNNERNIKDYAQDARRRFSFTQLRFKRIVDSMEFEWDVAKHLKNVRERGIGFDDAALALENTVEVWAGRNMGSDA